MAIEYTSEQIERIRRHLLLKFERAMRMNSNGTGTPVWKSIFFILDHVARGDFYGIIHLRIQGTVVKDPRIVERTFLVDDMYCSIEDGSKASVLHDNDLALLEEVSKDLLGQSGQENASSSQ